jgi:hypothetical protein
MAKNFPKLMKDTKPQIHKDEKMPNRINTKTYTRYKDNNYSLVLIKNHARKSME